MLRTPSTFPKVPPFHGETVFSLREACKQGNLREAVSTFTASLTEDRTSLLDNPDEAYAPLLELCAKSRASSLGRQVHAHVLKFGVATPESVFLSTKLVFMYGKCGYVCDSQKVFDKMSDRTIFTWNAMMGAYVSNGKNLEALELYRQIRVSGSPLDSRTFPCALKACGALGACRVHSNEELGEKVAKKLLELNPKNPGNHVLVSNLFAAESRWNDVRVVRMRMKADGLKKTPGCSWMEVGNKIHTFIARDKAHPESHKIYQKLAQIIEKLENEGGYVAQTKLVLHNVREEEKVEMLHGHSERLAIAYGLLSTSDDTPIRITKNLRICEDCHAFCKLVSRLYQRELVVRDASRFHCFQDGFCSCADLW
ncbi:unnamed protein product [Linum tenue]|uniref:DYW domain-containing protein n=1 Tax=Linum tenue TaxID=586396 RepID=A0AAV0MR79_9ROSI|nr:unnamed protein product [Linum tenue]